MSSLLNTPTRIHCTPQRRQTPQHKRGTVAINHRDALEFCLVSPAPNHIHRLNLRSTSVQFPLSPGIEVKTPPTPDTNGFPLPSPKSPVTHPTPCSRIIHNGRPSSFLKALRQCQLSTDLRHQIERLGWLGEQLFHPFLKQMAEGFVSTESISSDVQWMQLCNIRDTIIQSLLTHVESIVNLHHQQQVAYPPTVVASLERFTSLVEEINALRNTSLRQKGPESNSAVEPLQMITSLKPKSKVPVEEDEVEFTPRNQCRTERSSNFAIQSDVTDNSQALALVQGNLLNHPYGVIEDGVSTSRGEIAVFLPPSHATKNQYNLQVENILPQTNCNDKAFPAEDVHISSPLSERLKDHLKRQSVQELTKVLQMSISHENLEIWKEFLTETELLREVGETSTTSSLYLSSPAIRHAQKRLGDLWQLMEEFGAGQAYIEAATSGISSRKRKWTERQSSIESNSRISKYSNNSELIRTNNNKATDQTSFGVSIVICIIVRVGQCTFVAQKSQSFGVLQCMGARSSRKGKYVSMRAVTNKTKRTREKNLLKANDNEITRKQSFTRDINKGESQNKRDNTITSLDS